MKQKHLAVALSAIFAAAALTGCGSDSDSNFNYQPTPPTENPDTGTDPKPDPKPDAGDSEDNAGNANATDGSLDLKTETIVGAQQYVRGTTSDFDKANNNAAGNNANNTVLNPVKLQNEKLDNIVVGRETITRLDGAGEIVVDKDGKPVQDTVRRYVGQSVDGISDKASSATKSLQTLNKEQKAFETTLIDVADTSVTQEGDKNRKYYPAGGATAATYVKPTIENTGFPIYEVDGTTQATNSGGDPLFAVTKKEPSTVAVSTTGIDVTSEYNELNGLVTIDNDAETTLGLDDTSTSSVRIFGKNYRDTTNEVADNSHKFQAGYIKDKDGNITENLDISATNTGISNIKLNHVQYGRVTSNIDPLENAAIITAGGNADYFESELSTKNDPKSVDTYFYRGTGATTIEQMNALKEVKGDFQYAGHAVMYGIDNSYHGALGEAGSNSFGDTNKAVKGEGNFVEATVNMSDRKLTNGAVFNVWKLDTKDGGPVYRKDNLVKFEGDINGNTVKGNASLAYDAKNTTKDGIFKGSFFGKNAEELGGSLNSINSDSGYGKKEWGGVFGAQRVDKPAGNDNENSVN